MGDWEYTTIGEQVTLQRGIDITKAEQTLGNIPVISSGGISSFHNKAWAKGPGVILGRKGTVGSVYFVGEDYWPHDTTLWVRDFHGNDPRFVYYFFLSRAGELAALDVGTANPSLNRNHIHPIKVLWPDLGDQKLISKILGMIDDKIDLNRRMNRTLEEMAAAIFKSWFVDFDPVAAKSEGRQPFGMSEETAKLFPSKFTDSFTELLPEGWISGKIGDIGQNIRNGTTPNKNKSDMPYIGLEHMPRKDIALGEWGTAEEVVSNKYQFIKGDILFGKLRPYFHKVGVAPLNGVCSTDILVIRSLKPEWFGLLLGYLSRTEFVNYTDASSYGTKMPRTNWEDMSKYEIAIPNIEVSRRFTDIISPFINKIIANIHEARRLTELRDILLPKLLSGEISLHY